jgi:hypothetical protein
VKRLHIFAENKDAPISRDLVEKIPWLPHDKNSLFKFVSNLHDFFAFQQTLAHKAFEPMRVRFVARLFLMYPCAVDKLINQIKYHQLKFFSSFIFSPHDAFT